MAKGNQNCIRPTMRFPGFSDGWSVHELGDFLTESRIAGTNGSVARKLTVKLWGNGVVAKTETIKGSTGTQYYVRKAGQFIYSKLDFLNGAFGVIPDSLDGFESTTDLPAFDVKASLDGRFLTEFVGRPEFFLRFGEIADGGRKAKRIQVGTFLSLPIAIPPTTAEQARIAECLTTLDDVVAAQSEKVTALNEHKQGLMQRLFPREGEVVPRLRFPEFRSTSSWHNGRLAAVLEKVSEPVDVSVEKTYREIGVRSHGRGVFHKRPTSGEAIGAKRVFRVVENALVVNIVFAWEQAVATTSKAEEGMIASHRFPMFVPSSGRCDVRYVKYFLLTKRGKRLLGLASPGGAGRNRTLGQNEFDNMEIPMPASVKEQSRIADLLELLDEKIAVEADKLTALETHRAGLMQQLFPAATA